MSVSRADVLRKELYVRAITITVTVTKVTISIPVGDGTLVIEVPIIAADSCREFLAKTRG